MSKLPPHLQELTQGLPHSEARRIESAIVSLPHLIKQGAKGVRKHGFIIKSD